MTITNLWGELTYKVTEIRIVHPDDIEAILIQEGKDMITLMTCHPPNSGGKYRYPHVLSVLILQQKMKVGTFSVSTFILPGAIKPLTTGFILNIIKISQ